MKAKARSWGLCGWARWMARAMLLLGFPGLSLILSWWIWVDNLRFTHGIARAQAILS